ncbi:MAG: hypothetical protein Q4P14_01315 [Methanobacteriaceae archaeon]|nr:hypothetical protein [Methanobacteriaceae archaeon]
MKKLIIVLLICAMLLSIPCATAASVSDMNNNVNSGAKMTDSFPVLAKKILNFANKDPIVMKLINNKEDFKRVLESNPQDRVENMVHFIRMNSHNIKYIVEKYGRHMK